MDLSYLLISWLPKVAGLIGGFGAYLTSTGDMTWGPLLTSLGVIMLGFVSRQDNKSSEDVKIKDPEVVVMVTPPEVVVTKHPRGSHK